MLGGWLSRFICVIFFNVHKILSISRMKLIERRPL